MSPITFTLRHLAETALASNDRNNASGDVQSIERLLSPDTLHALDAAHQGVYAFIAYDADTDKALSEYVTAGHLENHATSSVLALYISDPNASWEADWPQDLPTGLISGQRTHASYLYVRACFRDKPPRLPGVLLLARLSTPSEPIFVSVATVPSDRLTDFMNELLHYVTTLVAQGNPAEHFAEAFAAGAAKSDWLHSRYQRRGSSSSQENLMRLWGWLLRNGKDLIGVLKFW